MGRRDSFFLVSDSHVESSQTFWSANPGNSMTHLFARFWTRFLGCEETTRGGEGTHFAGHARAPETAERARIRRGRVAIASPGRLEDSEVSRESDTRRRTAPTSESCHTTKPSVSGCPLFDVPLAPPRPSRRGRRIRRPSPISADGRGGRGRVQAVAGAESRTPRVGLPVRRGDPVGQPAGPSSVSIKRTLLTILETMRFLLFQRQDSNPAPVAC